MAERIAGAAVEESLRGVGRHWRDAACHALERCCPSTCQESGPHLQQSHPGFSRARYFGLTEMVSTRSWLSKIWKDVFRFPHLLTQPHRPICQPEPARTRR